MHPRQVRAFIGHGRQHALPDSVLVPVAEAAEVVGMAGADLRIPAQVAVQGLEIDIV